mgnify:CR=1 FL=1
MEHILTRCGEGGYRPAVEAVFQCNYVVAVRAVLLCGVFSRRFYCTFVGLRAGVREENFFHARAVAEHLRELHARLCVVEVRHVLDFARLLGYCFYPFVVAMPKVLTAMPEDRSVYIFPASSQTTEPCRPRWSAGTSHKFRLCIPCPAAVIYPLYLLFMP